MSGRVAAAETSQHLPHTQYMITSYLFGFASVTGSGATSTCGGEWDLYFGQNLGLRSASQKWCWVVAVVRSANQNGLTDSHSHPAVSHTHSDHRRRSRPGWIPQNIRKITFFALRRTPKTQFLLERGGALRALNARFPDQVEQPQNNFAFPRSFRAGSPLFKFAAVFCPPTDSCTSLFIKI